MKETQNIEFKRQWRDDFLAELSGYEKIRKAFENEQLQFPTFEQVRGGMLATIQRERFVAISNGASQKNGQETESGTENGTESGTENTKDKIIQLILSNPQITSRAIAKELDMALSGIAKHLRNLQALGYIRRVGPQKGGHWEVLLKSEEETSNIRLKTNQVNIVENIVKPS